MLDGTTLYFYYDDQMSSRGGIDINISEIPEGSVSPYGTATTAVIDASFANYRPTSTAYWFMGCSSLTTISELENLKTDDVTDMSMMFGNCSSLTSLNLSSFNTQSVTSMFEMFCDCSGLTSLNVSHFNTQNVTDMSMMFYNCSSLTSLDLSGFNTQNVTDMRWMFYNCSHLTSLDLSGFNTQNVTYMNRMFDDCSLLTTIYVGSDWGTATVTESSNMFLNCRKLVGGAGTTYDASHTDAEYARIDGGPNSQTPGYFTAKSSIPDNAITIFVKADVAPYLFAWYTSNDGSTVVPAGEFPGIMLENKVTVRGTEFWYYTFAEDIKRINIIFSNGKFGTDESAQTGDITYITSNRYFTYDGSTNYEDVTIQYGGTIPDIELTDLSLAGNHNEWSIVAQPFTAVEQGKSYTLDLDLSGVTIEENVLQFKLVANDELWIGGNDGVTLNAPSYVGYDTSTTGYGNFLIDLTQTTCRKFKFEATWSGGNDLCTGWTLKISEVQVVYEPYAVLSDNNTVLTFFYAGLLLALALYVYFAFIDKGYLLFI